MSTNKVGSDVKSSDRFAMGLALLINIIDTGPRGGMALPLQTAPLPRRRDNLFGGLDDRVGNQLDVY